MRLAILCVSCTLQRRIHLPSNRAEYIATDFCWSRNRNKTDGSDGDCALIEVKQTCGWSVWRRVSARCAAICVTRQIKTDNRRSVESRSLWLKTLTHSSEANFAIKFNSRSNESHFHFYWNFMRNAHKIETPKKIPFDADGRQFSWFHWGNVTFYIRSHSLPHESGEKPKTAERQPAAVLHFECAELWVHACELWSDLFTAIYLLRLLLNSSA